jgi:hypothetical protein
MYIFRCLAAALVFSLTTLAITQARAETVESAMSRRSAWRFTASSPAAIQNASMKMTMSMPMN